MSLHDTIGLAHRLRDAAQGLGWRLPLTSLLWALRPRYLVFARDLSLPLPDSRPGVVTRWTVLTTADIPAVAAIDPAMTPAEFARRLPDGQECRLARVGEGLAYYYWETAGPTLLPYLGTALRPLPGQVCGCGTFTAARYRRRGIHTEAMIRGLYEKRARGVSTVINFVPWWNGPSRRVYAGHVGGVLVGSIGYWNLGPWRHYFVTGMVRLDGPASFCVEV